MITTCINIDRGIDSLDKLLYNVILNIRQIIYKRHFYYKLLNMYIMKKILLFLFLIACMKLTAQQVGDGAAQTISSFNSILNTGVYDSEQAQTNYPYEIPQWPWKYLFVMRHSNQNLNYQFQISTTFEHDDRVFFRKLAHLKTDTEYNNNWQEFATRGANTFNGVQTVNGDQYVNGNMRVSNYLFIPTNKTLFFGNNTNSDHCLKLSYIGDDNRGDSYIDYSENLFFRNGSKNNDVPIIVFGQNGNVGIGTISPKCKLDVNGTIRTKEIIVESVDWADFVFKKGYNLPTLKEVEQHIGNKGTLPGVPTEEEIKANGMNLSETNALLLQKIEELTLYIIQQDKRLKAVESKLEDELSKKE